MLYLGKLVNTHGLKGEVKILSDFKYKNLVFTKGNTLYIDNTPYKIKTYRSHQKFDMVTFENYENIEDVISLKNKNIYIKKEDYNFPGPLNEELYGKNVYDGNKLIGTLKEINNTSHQELLVIAGKTKEYLVPYVKPFIQKITNDGIYLNVIEGLIDEDWYFNYFSWNVRWLLKSFNY